VKTAARDGNYLFRRSLPFVIFEVIQNNVPLHKNRICSSHSDDYKEFFLLGCDFNGLPGVIYHTQEYYKRHAGEMDSMLIS
jgi:hypothetical protein